MSLFVNGDGAVNQSLVGKVSAAQYCGSANYGPFVDQNSRGHCPPQYVPIIGQ